MVEGLDGCSRETSSRCKGPGEEPVWGQETQAHISKPWQRDWLKGAQFCRFSHCQLNWILTQVLR